MGEKRERKGGEAREGDRERGEGGKEGEQRARKRERGVAERIQDVLLLSGLVFNKPSGLLSPFENLTFEPSLERIGSGISKLSTRYCRSGYSRSRDSITSGGSTKKGKLL